MDESTVIEVIKSKFNEIGTVATIPLIKGDKSFTANLKDDGIYVDNLGNQPFLPWSVFTEAIKLIQRKGGKALKGDAMNSKLGDEKLSLDSVEGYIAYSIYGKKIGDSVFRRISSIVGILIWTLLCKNEPGYLILNDIN